MTSSILPRRPKLFLLCLLVLYLSTQPATATSLSDWLHNPPYRNGTLVEEIQCYSLPYGGIGFASHILTYYTIAMLAAQRHPYAPWVRNKHSSIDLLLAIFGLLVAIIVSSLTIVRCRSKWQFIAIAAWKLDLSVTFGLLSLHAAAIIPKSRLQDFEDFTGGHGDAVKVLFWLLLYIPGVAAGMAGLLSLVAKTIGSNHNVMIVTAVFGAITLFVAAVVGMIVCCTFTDKASTKKIFGSLVGSGVTAGVTALGCFGVLGAFYSDWILASIAENMSGAPSSDNAALYWTSYIA